MKQLFKGISHKILENWMKKKFEKNQKNVNVPAINPNTTAIQKPSITQHSFYLIRKNTITKSFNNVICCDSAYALKVIIILTTEPLEMYLTEGIHHLNLSKLLPIHVNINSMTVYYSLKKKNIIIKGL